jgi:hypothetical protein
MLHSGVESGFNYLSPYPEYIESVPEHGSRSCPAHYLVGPVFVSCGRSAVEILARKQEEECRIDFLVPREYLDLVQIDARIVAHNISMVEPAELL